MSEMDSSYSTLFGSVDHAEGNESRSVLSPTAYLVDLLNLAQGTVYHDRRPDVGQIKLDQANTYTEIPQLDIANRVMATHVTASHLTSRLFPEPLPFSEQFLRLRTYAEKLGTNLEELERLYRSVVDAQLSARLLLGLSAEEYDLYVTPHASPSGISDVWGVPADPEDEDYKRLLAGDLELIKKKLNVSLKELKELVRQDLSADELVESDDSVARRFFINQGPNYIVLDDVDDDLDDGVEEKARLRLHPQGELNLQHLDRMMRLVRLARRLGLSFTDMDWLLQSTCRDSPTPTSFSITLDENGMQAIAVALAAYKLGELPVDEVAILWGKVKDYGQGDATTPADLFNRVFSNGFPSSLQALVNKLIDDGKTADELDERLQAVLRISGPDYLYLKNAFRMRGVAPLNLVYQEVVDRFTAFLRVVKLASSLSLDVREVVTLLDLLGAQWTVSEDHELSIPAPYSAPDTALNPLALLVQPDTPAHHILDVVQKMVRVKAWLDLRQLAARQLAFICLADHAEYRARLDDGTSIDDVQTDEAVETVLEDLNQSLSGLLVSPAALQTGSLTPNGAQAVFDSLREARVLVTFAEENRALLRVIPKAGEIAAAMESGIAERLEIHATDLTALGFTGTDIDTLFSLLVLHGYAERFVEGEDEDAEVHHFLAPGLNPYFSNPNNAVSFAVPNFQARAESIFLALQQRVNAAQIEPAALVAAGVELADVPALFAVLLERSYVVGSPTPTAYRVADAYKAFFADLANLPQFALPDFSAAYAVLASKVENYNRADTSRKAESEDLEGRLLAIAEQQTRVWLRTLSGFVGLSEDVTELAAAWSFGTPDQQVVEALAGAAAALFRAKQNNQKPLEDAFLASRFRRLQQLALLLRKTAMSADEARVYLENQRVHRGLPETLKAPASFLSAGPIDALTMLPNGDFLMVSGLRYVAFSRVDYRLLSTGTLDLIPGVTWTDPFNDPFKARVLVQGFDAVFSDTVSDDQGVSQPVLHLCSGDLYVTVSAAGTSPAKPITDWGVVRNNIQDNFHVDAAVQDPTGNLFLFSGDQYVKYGHPEQLLAGPSFVDERYPKSIRGKFEKEGLTPLPAAMFSKVDSAFRDGDNYYFFSGNSFTHSTDPYQLQKIRPVWGHVLNYLFEENRVDATFVLGNATYLTSKNQLTRYTGPSYQIVDERFPVTFGNIAESEPLLRVLRRFPNGLDAVLAGRDGALYAFKNGSFASSAAPDTSLTIRDAWGRVRNVFIDNQRVDGALFYNGMLYLFCGDQYVRYSSSNYEFVDEGYPKRVHANWNAVEHVGQLPAGLPLPVTAVVVGRTPSGTTDDVYFFGGSQFAGPTGALASVKTQWARVRNSIERNGLVDAALLDGNGRMYLFSGDQFYRYSSPEQTFVDETYPRTLAGNWAQEGTGYSLPAAFNNGISAAVRGGDGRIFLFSGQNYARVDASPTATPRPNTQDWGVVRNWIQTESKVGAAFVDATGKTFLFGGDQFVRYSSANYDFIDEGYPLTIGTRWGLPESFRSDVDSALLFRSPVDNVQRLYIFKGDNYVRYSTSNFTQVDAGYPKRLRDGVSAEGLWFRGFVLHELPPFPIPNDWIDAIEATYVDTFNNQPRIMVFYRHSGAGQWRREYRNGNWLSPVPMSLVNDYLPFTKLDAAFVGADGTLHAFSGDQYATRPPAGGALTTPVQIRTRWAKVVNRFAELGRVDATLSMGDGRTYLFCDNQFIKYSGALRPGDTDFYVDEGYPRRIDPNWPTESVPIELAPVFQPTGYDLCRDGTGKIHYFNGTRYNVSGNSGSDLLLTSRWGKVENRFHDLDRVDGAYRAENGKLYLFCDSQFTRYSGALQPGNPEFYADEGYPRKVATWWAAEGLAPTMPSTWNDLGFAVVRDAQTTYAFSGSTFVSSQAATPAPVIPQWAKVRNEMQTQNRVDAGFVFGQGANAVTLLFAADQYVRYSAGYDGFVDEGYPKIIEHLVQADGVFPTLPSELHAGLRAFFAGTDGNLHVFSPQPADEAVAQRYVSSEAGSTLRPLNERWGIVDNKLWDDEFVNAALHTPDGKLYLFSGEQFLRYTQASRTHVDEGYPRKISTSYAEELGIPALSPALNQGIDAALIIGTTHFYFAGDQVVSSATPTTSRPLVEQWGRVDNRLHANQRLDAAFVAPNGKLYLFAENQVSVYSGKEREHVDEEYPRNIAGDIGAEWPVDFTANLTAAAAFEGRSYLFKGDSHVRISDFRLEETDEGYPLTNAEKFVDRFDFELRKLPEWWRAKQLFDDYAGQIPTLLEYLDNPNFNDPRFIAAPFDPKVVALARATQWSIDAIQALLPIYGMSPQSLLDLRNLAKLGRAFELGDRIGTAPQKIKSELWDCAFVAPPTSASWSVQLEPAADFLFQLIKAATSTQEWPEVSRSLYNVVANQRRDALVAYLVENDPAGTTLKDPNDLYELLLTDVLMDASLDTSNVVEAINSVQLYFHRTLMQLEVAPSKVYVQDLRRWWPWMKNYRIWEANRKVFLHPENYIRPELRTEKSPAFIELEEKLLQDEITAISVREAYQTYLDAFHEIARLRIVGGYRYTHDGTTDNNEPTHEAVFMTGVSRTTPPVFYYRFGAVLDNQTTERAAEIDWEPWQKIGITIDADRVQPVFAFNRLFLFWIETTPYNSTEFSSSDDESYSADSEEAKKIKVTLKFTFYNFNKEWVAPQTVVLNPDDPSDPESLPYVFPADSAKSISISARNPVPFSPGNDALDYIVLTIRWTFFEWRLGKLNDALDLVRESYQGWSFHGLRFLGDREAPFPPHLGIAPRDVTASVVWGHQEEAATGQWFSFDAKGGTFLCRPWGEVEDPITGQILGREFSDVRALLTVPKQVGADVLHDVFVFTQTDRDDSSTLAYNQRVATSRKDGDWAVDDISATDPAFPWGRLAGTFRQFPNKRIQNVIVSAHDNTTFFLLGSEYFTYSGNSYTVVNEELVNEFHPDSPSEQDVIGTGVSLLNWTDVTATGRSLVRAYKVPGADEAAVVSRASGGQLGIANELDLDELRTVSNSGSGSPFDGWDTLDTVFQLSTPEPSVVFSRGLDLVIYNWTAKSWTTQTLSLPSGATRLSAAFLGLDDKLYFFMDNQYAEADPANLGGSLMPVSVDPRWGQLPSLFSTKLNSIDGAFVGPDSKVYLFSDEYCLPFGVVDPTNLDELVVLNEDGEILTEEPPKVGDLWLRTTGTRAAINQVDSAFASGGNLYMTGWRQLTLGRERVLVRYSQADAEAPFHADRGYPTDFDFDSDDTLPTEFYAALAAPLEQVYSITRLTSNTSDKFSRELFAKGIPGLLSLKTQREPELPFFTTIDKNNPDPPQPPVSRDELRVDADVVPVYPGLGQERGIDLSMANANEFYYWEIFFHIPFLIAQTLKQGQRFEEAMHWYEYVFDPTTLPEDPEPGQPTPEPEYWNFLAFVDKTPFERRDLKELDKQLTAYREDPFDPHAIAALRPMAYRKAFVMSYVDNLILWGDMLFRQYTRETIGEATMLYVRAADILGKRPDELGKRVVSPTVTYEDMHELPQEIRITPEILMLENGVPPISRYEDGGGTLEVPHDTMFNPYFYIPENQEFVSYWNRVEDRLSKIRYGLNIDGVKQSLALFAPPVDVMALVQAFASGAGLAQLLAEYNMPVPNYRFAYMLGRARELTSRLTGLGSELLSALEKKDAEELSLLRNTQERQILELQLEVKENQLENAKESLAALQEGLRNAKVRESHYQQLLSDGLSVYEQTQIATMIIGQQWSQVANVLSAAASVASYAPQVGSPFALTYGGQQIGAGITGMSAAFRAQAEMASFQSSLAATLGGWERRGQDWQLQKSLATGETLQIGRQIRAAEIQVEIADQEIKIQERQIKNNESVDTFMNSKFTNKQLYQWMVGKLSSVYFQTYNLALQYAKAAQRAMQFELALPERDVKYIGSGYWDSLRKGLLSGQQLQLDLDRLEQAYIDANARRLEITRHVSLLQVDPLALVRLKEQGRCEFELTEALFDGDFPGHYCRQIKTVSLSFPAVVGPYHNFNATLTQLGHRTLLTPDKKALIHLLGKPAEPPIEAHILRLDFRPNQQVALSTGVNDSGLFQVNYSDERYLPFEGTGAVSRWRLELNGVDAPMHRNTLSDVIVTVQYTARRGGSAFAETVKSALGNNPSERAWVLNLASDYSDAWQAFMANPTGGLSFNVDRRNLPGSTENQVTGVYLHYELTTEPEDDLSRQALKLTVGSTGVPQLKPGAFKSELLPVNVTWKLEVPSASARAKFNPRNIRSIYLAVTYKNKVKP